MNFCQVDNYAVDVGHSKCYKINEIADIFSEREN